MAATPEGKVKADAVKIIKRFGDAYYYFIAQNGYGVAGGFDLIVILNGFFLGIEFKADPKKKPTPLQSRNAAKTVRAGGTVLLIHAENLPVLESTLQRMKDAEIPRISWGNVWPTEGDFETPI